MHMGLIKDTKANIATQHATRARAEGHTVLLYRQDVGATSSGFSGPVSGAAEVIEAIERCGWVLQQMAFDDKQSRNGGVLLLFRPAAQHDPSLAELAAARHAAPMTGDGYRR